MKKTNIFKLAALTAVFALAGMFANAQTNPSTASITAADSSGVVVKVIDNKGTVKYLQSNNGITTVTSTSSGNLTRTTFQLGGSLTDNTYIDVDGKIFAFNGLELETGAASTDAEDESDAGTGTGWTILVRDEETGAIKKLLVSDLVQSGWSVFQLSATPETGFTIPGVSLATYQTVYVYRNGAKLIAGIDYTIGATDNTITLIPAATGSDGTPTGTFVAESFTLYQGDVIEVHFIK